MAQKIRYVVLDALRGFALLGIILANFPEFSLWTFADPATHTPLDRVVRGLQFFFIDGKFYTLFSLLFGIGFGIQLENSGHSTTTFYRRMATLFVIGFLHLMLHENMSTSHMIALGVYLIQMLFSRFWLNHFLYGPVEWVWRMITYRKRLPMLRDRG